MTSERETASAVGSQPSAVQAAQQAGGATGDTLFRTFMAEAEKAGITHWPALAAQQVAAEPAIENLIRATDAVCQRVIEQDGGILGGIDFYALRKAVDRCRAATQPPAQPAGEPDHYCPLQRGATMCRECDLNVIAAATPARDVALSEAPPSRVHILRDKSDPVGEMWLLDSTGKPLGDTGPIRVPQAWHMALRDEKDAIERRLTQPKGRV